MGNVLRILLRDFKRLLKAPAALIVVGALLVLPSLYTWYNVVAFWNPYEATGNLSVCVVNQDAGTSNDMTGRLDVGDKLIEELQANDQLKWITNKDYDTAIEDLKAGRVYAVYVIPSDFSACLVSPLTGNVKGPRIEYYANEKLGPVSPKITDTAASALEQKINSAFVATVTEVATQAIDDALKDAKTDIAAAEAKASARTDEAKTSVVEVRTSLSEVADTIDDARSKVGKANGVIAETSTLVNDMRTVLKDAQDETESLESSLADISSKSIPELSSVVSELSRATTKATALAGDIAAAAGEAQTDAGLVAAKIQPIADTLRETASDLEAAAARVSKEDLRERLTQAAQDMNARASEVQDTFDTITALAEQAESASQSATKAAETLGDSVAKASNSFEEYSSNLFGSAASTVESGAARISSVCAELSAALSSLDAAASQAQSILGQLDKVLVDCKTAVSQTNTLIGDAQTDLDAVMADARMLAQSEVINNLMENGTLNSQNISAFMGSPTELSTTQFYHPNAYGTAMAPLFMNLTFWIGAFMLVIIFLLEVDSEGIEELKPWQRYLGRFIMFCIFAAVQAIICCAGTLALGVQAANVPALFVAACAASLAFLSIIYALSSTFRHVGKALCIVLVFAQIPGASGLYPVEMTSSFFQAIYPFLPFTYGIDAMRESICGFYGSVYAQDLFTLAVFFFASLGFGLLLGPLMSNVVHMTARQVYEGDLYNGEDAISPERPYRLAHMLRAITEKESYRKELEERYARFSRRYPVFIRASIVLGVGVPVVLALLLALDTAEKTVLLTCFLFWLIALIGFLVVVESQRYSFERQLDLKSMSEDRLLRFFANRNRMVRASIRRSVRGKDAEGVGGQNTGGKPQLDKTEGFPVATHAKPSLPGGMHNVWTIARRDLSGLFKNVMSVVITVGLVVLPSLFAWYNILACWNVFDNTSKLSVAVANQDAGFKSDLMPVSVNIGSEVVSALHENDQINWVFTNAEDAVEGVKAGSYYAALVIPAGFSRNMLTFYEGDSASATIDYYVNEKKNAIAPNITGIGADTVSHEVNAAFTNTISEVAIGIGQSLSKISAEGNLDANIAALSEHMRNLAQRFEQSASVLDLHSSLGKDAQGLVHSSAEALTSARENLQKAATDIDAGKNRLKSLAASLASSLDDVSASLSKADSAVAELEARANELTADTPKKVLGIAKELRGKASDIDAKTNTLSNILAVLEKLRDDLKSGASKQIEEDIAHGAISIELSVEAEVMVENTIVLDKDIATLKKAIEILQKASADCTSAADSLESGVSDIENQAAALRKLVETAKTDAASVKASLESELMPRIAKLKTDVDTLVGDLERGADELRGLDPNLARTLESAATGLGEASTKTTGAAAKLRETAQRVRNLADAVDDALNSGDVEKLRSLLSENASDLAAALTAPVTVERTALFPSENSGSAMTPLYCTLALFIGALLIMVAMKPEVSRRGRKELVDPKPRHLYFGRFVAVGVVSLMQTTLLGLGCMLFLKVQVANPLLFMLGFWFAGLVLAFMIYTLVVAFGNLGKAIAVLLLIVQVTACGGSYPLQMLPDFVQAISPWVPATYIVDALQAAMMGVYQNDFWVSMGTLALFIIPFLLLGLALRKPMERFMKLYVSKVEECRIME